MIFIFLSYGAGGRFLNIILPKKRRGIDISYKKSDSPACVRQEIRKLLDPSRSEMRDNKVVISQLDFDERLEDYATRSCNSREIIRF